MRKFLSRLLAISSLAGLLSVSQVSAAVECQHKLPGHETASNSLYVWSDNQVSPKAIILAIHGVTLHGGAYEALGNELAPHGYVVISPDLTGFGHLYQKDDPLKLKVIYDRSTSNLTSLLKDIRSTYPGLPVICAGESMGAHLAMRLAAMHPELVDGLLLSASSTKVHFPPIPLFVKDLSLWAVHPHRQINLEPYIRNGISDDDRIADERISDPLSRNSLNTYQLMKFGWMCRRTIDIVSAIPANMPVLILQGKKDKLYKATGVDLLMANLRTTDKKVQWFPKAGHILLETKYLKPETLSAVNSWLDKHTNGTGDSIATESTVTGTIESPKVIK